MTREENKRMHQMTCKKCGEINDITDSKAVSKLIVEIKSLRDTITYSSKAKQIFIREKNGEIQKLHRVISKALGYTTAEQRKEVLKTLRGKNGC